MTDLDKTQASSQSEPTIRVGIKPVADGPPPQGKKKRSKGREWTTLAGLIAMVTATIVASLSIAIVIRQARIAEANTPFQVDFDIPTATPNATPNPAFLAPTMGADGEDRVVILLMGGDARSGEGTTRPLTDSMMLLMLDKEHNVAGVISIPRDLYVDIPGHGLNRINTAFPYGGGALAVETVEYNLGVEVDHFVLINFQAFERFIDEIGGVTVYVPKTINDTNFPATCETRTNCGYSPFYIEAGTHVMDGETALKYARTRQSDNDYERARRQQAVLFAIRDKVINPTTYPTLVRNAPTLYQTLNDGIRTDMTLEDMIALADIAKDLPREHIRSAVIDSNYVRAFTTEGGASVLIPNLEAIDDLIYETFWLNCENNEIGCPDG